MKQYEKPTMDLMRLQAEDVITLSVDKTGEYDPTIEGNGNPWATSN